MKCPVCNAEIAKGSIDCPSCHLTLERARRLNDLAKKMAKDQELPDEVWEELYSFADYGEGWQVVEYLGSSPTLYLPAYYRKKPILHVGEYAFDSAPILAVHLPDTITSIGKGAFWHCNLLKLVALPNDLRTIGEEAFLGCSDLTSISLPDSIITLGAGCFADCGRLSKVSLPASLDGLPDRMFLGCDQLKSLSLPKDLVSLGNQSLEGTGISRLTLPATSLYVGERALANTPLATISIPDEVEALGRGAFADCAALAKVRLGKGLKQVGEDCFAYTALSDISVAKGNPDFAVKGKALLNGETLVVGTALSTVAPEVKVIARHAFVGIKGLHLDVPHGVFLQPEWAFDCPPTGDGV